MKVILDGNYMSAKDEMHRYLKEKFQLPDYYGRNLDALYDCLSEEEGLTVEVIHYDPSDKIMKSAVCVMKDAGVDVITKVSEDDGK